MFNVSNVKKVADLAYSLIFSSSQFAYSAYPQIPFFDAAEKNHLCSTVILQETVWQSNCHNIGSVNITIFLVGTSVTEKKSGSSATTLTELSSANDRGSECLLERVSETAAAGTGTRLKILLFDTKNL